VSAEPGRIDARLELVAAVLLALATVATAWSGYQASRWNAEASKAAARAGALRIESVKADGLANAQTQVDVATFSSWVDAYAQNQTELADFYFSRFREEFRPALEAWIATRPLTNPDAPLTPFAMPEYRLEARDQAARLETEAGVWANTAVTDIQRATNYVLAAVFLAASLFLAGTSARLSARRLRRAMALLGLFVFVGAAVWLATFPVSVSV
jgi:hypothetical protein